MNEQNLSVNLMEIYREEGVRDLTPTTVRSKFAQALKTERLGDFALAEQLLNTAVQLEAAVTAGGTAVA